VVLLGETGKMMKNEGYLMIEDDYIVRMPPKKSYTVHARIKKDKGTPCFAGLIDEVKVTMEICGCGLAKELCCWDELSDEALAEFENLIDESAPPETFWDKLQYWTFDDWIDYLRGAWCG